MVLEMVTGKGPSRSVHAIDDGGDVGHKRLVTLVREKMNPMLAANIYSIEEIVDQYWKANMTLARWKLWLGLLYNM